MTVPIGTLELLQGRALPGGELVIEPHEAFIADDALRSSSGPPEMAHPVWFVMASLRCMGITVEDLCELAHQGPDDVLLLGNCRVEQHEPLACGTPYRATAEIGRVGTRQMRDGSRLDSVDVVVRLVKESDQDGVTVGEIVSTYLFKRGQEDTP
jgi:hypothetical protein